MLPHLPSFSGVIWSQYWVKSATSITGRRLSRSTHTPAGSPISRNAAVPAAESTPISNGVAASAPTASSGSTVRPIVEPNWLMVSPAHSRRKSR